MSSDWSVFAYVYNPIEVGSIDRTDVVPHDKAIARALKAKYVPDPFVTSNPYTTIFVARLNPKTTEKALEEVFSKYGHIVSCRLVRDIVTGFSKGYAFIEYTRQEFASTACERAHKMELDRKIIFVDHERERKLRGWIPRRLGGGFGGDKRSGQLRFGCKDRYFKKPIPVLQHRK